MTFQGKDDTEEDRADKGGVEIVGVVAIIVVVFVVVAIVEVVFVVVVLVELDVGGVMIVMDSSNN